MLCRYRKTKGFTCPCAVAGWWWMRVRDAGGCECLCYCVGCGNGDKPVGRWIYRRGFPQVSGRGGPDRSRKAHFWTFLPRAGVWLSQEMTLFPVNASLRTLRKTSFRRNASIRTLRKTSFRRNASLRTLRKTSLRWNVSPVQDGICNSVRCVSYFGKCRLLCAKHRQRSCKPRRASPILGRCVVSANQFTGHDGYSANLIQYNNPRIPQ